MATPILTTAKPVWGANPPTAIRWGTLTGLSSTNGTATSTSGSAAPVAVNAGTTYGNNIGVSNAYGVGSTFQSTSMVADAQTAKAAKPSVWWLIGAFILIAVLA